MFGSAMKAISLSGLALVFCLLSFVVKAPADDVLVEDGFEGSLGNWTPTNGAGLFTWSGSGDNYASVGSGAAYVPRTYNGPALTLIEPLPLETKAYTNVTISFDWIGGGGGTVKWSIQYSADGGTNWTTLTTLQGYNAYPNPPIRYSKTLQEGTYAFTDNAHFRIWGHAQTPAHKLYVDEMLIIGSPTPPPKGMVLIFQ